jgi:Flp pilus assembly protein TadG
MARQVKRLVKAILTNDDGLAVVLFALMSLVLMGFGGLVVDVGKVSLTKAQLQNAADAAALAGVRELPDASAATIAENYAIQNGIPEDAVAINPNNTDPTKLEVVCTQDVHYSLARVLGLSGTSVTTRAVAQAGSGGAAFDYTVFSGSPNHTLTFNGSNTYIGGSAHSNYRFTINGSHQEITQSAEAVSGFTMNGSHQTIGGTCQAATILVNGSHIDIGERDYSPAPFVEMPDFSDLVQSEAQAEGNVYTGNKTYNGSNIDVDSPIYVDGNVTINGSHFTGNGVILASGNITFNGSNLSSSGSAVCFYSKNGNITINGAHAELEGIVYAPNGSITMNGSHQTVNGRVVGNRVVFNGSTYNISAGTDDLQSLPTSGAKLIE